MAKGEKCVICMLLFAKKIAELTSFRENEQDMEVGVTERPGLELCDPMVALHQLSALVGFFAVDSTVGNI